MAYFLGIDGGGTRTSVWLGDGEGRVLARAETGPSNPVKVGFAAAQREILRAFRACWRQTGVTATSQAPHPKLLRAACAGIAGVDRPKVYDRLLSWMRGHIPARRHLLRSDAAIALAAAVQDGPGIIVIAGTGSIACARDDQGKLLRAGGWGTLFDDRGSGYDLGRKAVAAALEAFDGRGPATLLTERICRRLELVDIPDIVFKQLELQHVAVLAPLVEDAAREGDLVACHLCDAAGRDLAQLTGALLKRAGWQHRSPPVFTSGGVFRSHRVRQSFARHLRRIAPQARIEPLERPAVEGALWLARSLDRKKPGQKSN